MLYTVIAYRWGRTNTDHYQVAACSDADEACTLAQAECDDRAGKYGVAVYEWTSATDQRRIAYYPSSYAELRPHVNHRIEMFRSIGQRVHDIATTHTVWGEPTPGVPGSTPTEVVPPEWLSNLVEVQEKFHRLMRSLQTGTTDRHAAGLPALSSEETKLWVETLSVLAEQEARALLAQAPQRAQTALQSYAKRKSGAPSAGAGKRPPA